MMLKRALIDFDKTITSGGFPEPKEPRVGAKESLEYLIKIGYEIYIYSCRTSRDVFSRPIDRKMQILLMESYLKKYDIPFTEVLGEEKPVADLYIGDEAIRCYEEDNGGWARTIKELKDILGENCG